MKPHAIQDIWLGSRAMKIRRKLQSKKVWLGFLVSLFRYLLVFCIIFIILYPLFARFANAFMSEEDLFDKTVTYIPKHFSLDSFRLAMEAMDFEATLLNTTLLTVLVSALQVVSCTLIGYGFGRFEFYGRRVLYVLVIATMIIPPQTIMISQFLQFRFFDPLGLISLLTGQSVNLIDTLWPFGFLAATGLGIKNGLYIYLMTQFFRGMPKELEDAGYVDGAGAFKIYFRIMLPNAVPMMVTVLLFSVSWQWTDTYYSNLLLSDMWTFPRAVGAIATFEASTISPVITTAMNNAAMVLIMLPLLVLYIFTQRFFIQGLEKTGIVG